MTSAFHTIEQQVNASSTQFKACNALQGPCSQWLAGPDIFNRAIVAAELSHCSCPAAQLSVTHCSCTLPEKLARDDRFRSFANHCCSKKAPVSVYTQQYQLHYGGLQLPLLLITSTPLGRMHSCSSFNVHRCLRTAACLCCPVLLLTAMPSVGPCQHLSCPWAHAVPPASRGKLRYAKPAPQAAQQID